MTDERSFLVYKLATGSDQVLQAFLLYQTPHRKQQRRIVLSGGVMQNRILLENYFLPGDLERQIDAFVDHYNHRRYHESLGNLTPADVYFGRGQAILMTRERIKRETINQRRLLHRNAAA